MFNLLPETEKKKILQEYSLRRFVVLLVFTAVSLSIAAVCLFPSYVLSSIKLKEVSSELTSVRQSSVFQEADKLKSELTQANSKLLALQYGSTETLTEDLFAKVIDHKNAGVRMNGLMYKKGVGKAAATITISGIAQNREQLSLFVNELKKESVFKDVSLPVSSFTKDTNAEFTVLITGDF